MAFYNELKTHLQALVPAIYVETTEILRFRAELKRCCEDKELGIKKCQFWNPLDERKAKVPYNDFITLIEHLHSDELKPGVTVLEYADCRLNENNPDLSAMFTVMLENLRDRNHQVIIVAPDWKIPLCAQRDLAILDFPLPGRDDIKTLLTKIEKDFGLEDGTVDYDDKILDSVRGLGSTEIWNAFSKVAVDQKKITAEEIPLLIAEKEQIIRKSGYLEFVRSDIKRTDIGGLEQLQKWLDSRSIAFGGQARDHKLDPPKGVLLLGIPGTGKSLSAKAVSHIWNMPLLRLDMGRIFGGIVGESEANMRNAIKTAESLEPCVLWVDEIEKGLSGGASAGGERDGGTATRVFGSFLTWMQEKSKEVFVFATANDISRLPPELLRKGRFDEIFFVDLPDEDARRSIFEIHLKRKEQNTKITEELLNETEGFSGAEIEAIVNEALFIAASENKKSSNIKISVANLIESTKPIVPLSKTMSDTIVDLRKWAATRCRKASASTPPDIGGSKAETPRLRQERNNPFMRKSDEY